MTRHFLPVAAPVLTGNEKAYVMDCLESTWISSTGPYVERFERQFAEVCGVRHAICCSNGTTALHLALLALGVGPGDEVIVPSLTFVATANAVTYCGARPVLVDCRADTWTIDADAVAAHVTPRTRGIIAVHLFGNPADMAALGAIARRHGLFLLEDAAQAHGGSFQGRRVGSLGEAATFSFYGNKIVTTGEGGMVVTDDDQLATRARQLRSHGSDGTSRYWFPAIGFNYRLTNIAAALGVAQLERLDWQLERRREVVAWYDELLGDLPGLRFQETQADAVHAWWMFSVVVREDIRDAVMADLLAEDIETRPFVHPLHTLPPYRANTSHALPVAEALARGGINLPTWAGVCRDDVHRVCDAVSRSLDARGAAPRLGSPVSAC